MLANSTPLAVAWQLIHSFQDKQNFCQIESMCRWQNKCDSKIEIKFEKGRKHCGKRIQTFWEFACNTKSPIGILLF